MTTQEKARQMVTKFQSVPNAIAVVEEVREELLKQWNLIFPEETIGYWCNTAECKFWTLVKQELESGHPAAQGKSERWAKDYHE